jgi:hypothetical protein
MNISQARTVRVFLSSTVRDFAQLAADPNKRGHALQDADLTTVCDFIKTL